MQVLKGSFVALVTPMFEDGVIDYDSLKHLINWHIENGTSGIVSVGTTGESSTLSVQEHLDVIRYTVKISDNRIPVIAGSGGNSTQEAIDLTLESKNLGADASLLVTPYYNKPTQEGLVLHYLAIANKVNIPQILYNVPSRTACDLQPQSTKILSEHDNIIGIKEALDDMSRIKHLVELTKEIKNFSILSGDDPTFLESMQLGASGVISVAANIIPKSISTICKDSLSGNYHKAKLENDNYSDLLKLLFVESNPIPVKWMLSQMGYINKTIRLPLTDLNETYHNKVLSTLKELKVL
ncbi:MAG: 4-hydroxy-tetrahydrodipicolinate synthase [SAR86 cluster bacterium]|jgi:4-hydroxy-tetrahydrodipicolinate synthase|nr:4-hydroxy-tetrahydrodipicolinate synthase [SAR86 cluster bacterium]|tara:strand:+ start:2645 stop:3532 length:888 start_codon:yes stop_codon:yes gene_type:complete